MKLLMIGLLAGAVFGQEKAEKEPAPVPAAKAKTTTVTKEISGDTFVGRIGIGTYNGSVGVEEKTYNADGKLIVVIYYHTNGTYGPDVRDYTQHPMVNDEYQTLDQARVAAKGIAERWNSRNTPGFVAPPMTFTCHDGDATFGCLTISPASDPVYNLGNAAISWPCSELAAHLNNLSYRIADVFCTDVDGKLTKNGKLLEEKK